MRQEGSQRRAQSDGSNTCRNAGEALGREGNESTSESRPEDTPWYSAMSRYIFQGSVGSTQPRGLISRTRRLVPLGSLRRAGRPERGGPSTGGRVSRFVEDFSTPEIERLNVGDSLQPTRTMSSLGHESGAEHASSLTAQRDNPPLGHLARDGITAHETILEEPESDESKRSNDGGEGSAYAQLPVQESTPSQKPR